MTGHSQQDMTTAIGVNLPFLRRYARALTGHQDSGDRYAAATLEAILNDPDQYVTSLPPKVALFRVFHAIWSSSGMPVATGGETGLAARAQKHLEQLTENTREALLLHTIEEFQIDEVAQIMQVPQDEAATYIETAFLEMRDAVAGRILIIEDEAVIAMDLEGIVMDMGHRVTGVARTEQGALDLAAKEPADLILSDIQLADNSSGIDAVNRILERDGDRPVIFITAFPERLLTGEGPEPAFLISKPYTEDQVRSAVSQALFFASTETLIR
ncbi:response regulator [Maliponia aquimaris]|uniref:Putative transcriptional regulatory protein pdtaR n=1 Tax=Maliponia aquimaris TaxID=1673631 RepID=A0A238L117_9RHOB|nr:response regulator [Maliponia aquimaris]SMX48709.1 putative transcriptional regulatory protein pdtaR [Maliponia aquimaris]